MPSINSWITAFIAFLQGIDQRTAVAAGSTLVLLLLLLGLLRGRRTRAARWGGVKVVPRRGLHRSRPTRATRGPRDLQAPVDKEEGTPDMLPASTRNYHQALDALLRQPGKSMGARPLKRLLELARALDQHRAGSLQDLTGFTGEVEQLLGFEVHARPVPNSTGVALRFVFSGELIDEMKGPVRTEIADRVAERAGVLQRDLLDWLDSLDRLRPALGTNRAQGPRSFPSMPAAPLDTAVPPATPAWPSPPDRVASIDLSGLRSLDEAPSTRHDSRGYEMDRGPASRLQTTDSSIDVARSDVPTPAGDEASPRPSDTSERTNDDLRVERSIPRRPVLLGIPPRLARAIEEVDGVITELKVEPPTSLHAGERFFKADSSERTSLLDRLDRLVFTRLDDAGWTTAGGVDTKAAQAAAWFRRQQDQLAETLHRSFGLRPYIPAISDPFDPTEHIATDTVPTGDPRRDRTVAKTVKHGYVLEFAGERRFLERPKVTVTVFEANTPDADGVPDPATEPARSNAPTATDNVLDVPVDSAYPGERDFSITVYARWQATAPLRAWIDVDGHRLTFARAELIDVKGGQSTIQLSGCDIPEDLRRGDGVLFVEDGGRRQARHPFEVLT